MPSIRSPICDGSKRLPSSAPSRSPANSNSRRRRSFSAPARNLNVGPFPSANCCSTSHCCRADSAARTSRPKPVSRTVLRPPDASSRSSQVGASLIASSATGASERREMITGRSRRRGWAKPSARATRSLGMTQLRSGWRSGPAPAPRSGDDDAHAAISPRCGRPRRDAARIAISPISEAAAPAIATQG